MAKDQKGPPKDVLQHLVGVHSGNGTLDQLLQSGIGDEVARALGGQTGYLSGYTAPYGWEPWSYDGTTLTMLADINPGPASSYGLGAGWTVLDGDIYFGAYGPSGFELYKLDGATKTVSLAADVNPGAGDSSLSMLGGYAGDVYFRANDPVNGYELRKLDADTGTVSLVTNQPGTDYTFAWEMEAVGGSIFFSATTSSLYSSPHLYKLDAASGQFSMPSGAENLTFVSELFQFGGDLYFRATDPVYGQELHKVDGENGAVSLVADLSPGDSYPAEYRLELGGDLYFTSFLSSGVRLQKIDGVTGQITEVAQLPGYPQQSFFSFQDDIYFTAFAASYGVELHRFDPESGVVSLVADINPGSAHSWAGQSGNVVFEGDLYFSAYDPVHRVELRRLDGETGQIDTFDLVEGAYGGLVRVLGAVNGKLVLKASVDTTGAGTGDRFAMLVSDGAPMSAADFTIVDDGSGTFEPSQGGMLVLGDQLLV